MNVEERRTEILERFDGVRRSTLDLIGRMNEQIKILTQENEDLRGQLKQWGLSNTNGAKKGLFLK